MSTIVLKIKVTKGANVLFSHASPFIDDDEQYCSINSK